MKYLILGADGMAGYMLCDYFHQREKGTVYTTSRNEASSATFFLKVEALSQVEAVISSLQPNIVINGIGLLKEASLKNPLKAYEINSLFPHFLAGICDQYGGKLIQLSTDCVFRGDRGGYSEEDEPDDTTSYGYSKRLGEVVTAPHLTIRTSIIGPERREKGTGLFEWFRRQTGPINGFREVIWNGVTTLELARGIEKMIDANITGLYHFATPTPISKHELLTLLRDVFKREDVVITPVDHPKWDRSLKTVRRDFKYTYPSYKSMLYDLYEWMMPQ